MDNEKIKLLLANKDQLPPQARERLVQLLAERESLASKARAKDSFMAFVQHVWPNFIHGAHHARMAAAFERVARGECKRLIINMPPRHTKSEFASYLLPAWFLGLFPDKKIIQASNTGELAVGFGRKVRNLVDSEAYKEVFPQTELRADSKAAGRWSTSKNGEYFAIGVGGTVTGKGADILIIDDPHSEQEATLAEVNPEVYDKTYEWYTSGPRQRLQPGGAIILVMCMTGDTPVLMADGREKALRDIRAGDYVATFDKGRLATSKVNNWQSNGVDSIYKIQTRSGKILRANERHPFLVLNEGVLEWTRLNQLQVGDLLVSLKGVTDQHGRKQSRESVGHAKQKTVTTDATQTPPSGRLGIMGNGKRRPAASAGVVDPLSAVDCVPNTIRGNTSQRSHPSNPEHTTSSTVTVSLWHSTKQWLKNGITAAMSAVSRRRPRIPAPTGTTSCVSTTATTPGQCGGCYATTATSPSGMERHQAYLSELQRISDFTADPIVAITADGQAEVFDVEIDRTENFIANGVVSHNTRWSKKDLTGQVMKAAAQRGGEEWDVIEFPAILPSGNPLWPEFWPLPELEALRSELPNSKWMAQYQQNPTSDTSAIVKREWWKPWEASDPPPCDFILMSWDTAFEKHTRADYSACTTWGVFFHGDDTGTQQANIILLNAFRDRMEFPQLKQRAKAEYVEWKPDSIVIEKKATGAPLIYELRAAGVPVQEYTPSRGNDKISRLNAVADIFASGRVWAPNTRWAEEVIDEVASFPGGEHDDYVDSTSMALMRFRQGGFVRAAMDEDDTEFTRHLRRRRAPYY